jgi:hypothetical protein
MNESTFDETDFREVLEVCQNKSLKIRPLTFCPERP